LPKPARQVEAIWLQLAGFASSKNMKIDLAPTILLWNSYFWLFPDCAVHPPGGATG
jgi:hypothetical protein